MHAHLFWALTWKAFQVSYSQLRQVQWLSICCFRWPVHIGTASGSSVPCSFLVRSPQGEVISQKLHDQCRVLVRVLCNVVKFCNGILKGCASHFARFIRIIQHLVHEDRIVQSQTKANGVSDSQVLPRNLCCCSIGFACFLGCFALLVTAPELRNVTWVCIRYYRRQSAKTNFVKNIYWSPKKCLLRNREKLPNDFKE